MTLKQREKDVLASLSHAKLMVQTAASLTTGPDCGYYDDYLRNAEGTLRRCLESIQRLKGKK